MRAHQAAQDLLESVWDHMDQEAGLEGGASPAEARGEASPSRGGGGGDGSGATTGRGSELEPATSNASNDAHVTQKIRIKDTATLDDIPRRQSTIAAAVNDALMGMDVLERTNSVSTDSLAATTPASGLLPTTTPHPRSFSGDSVEGLSFGNDGAASESGGGGGDSCDGAASHRGSFDESQFMDTVRHSWDDAAAKAANERGAGERAELTMRETVKAMLRRRLKDPKARFNLYRSVMRVGIDHDIPLRTFLEAGEDLTNLKPDFEQAYIRAISRLSTEERRAFQNSVDEKEGFSDHPPSNDALALRAVFGHLF